MESSREQRTVTIGSSEWEELRLEFKEALLEEDSFAELTGKDLPDPTAHFESFLNNRGLRLEEPRPDGPLCPEPKEDGEPRRRKESWIDMIEN